jgi:hypothetical protein
MEKGWGRGLREARVMGAWMRGLRAPPLAAAGASFESCFGLG